MNISRYIREFIKLTVLSAAVCAVGLLMPSCKGMNESIQDRTGDINAVVRIITGAPETKAVKDTDINSIAIFAFKGDALVGYVYETGLTASGENVFPMNLSDEGAIDFYAIANPDPGFFILKQDSGETIDLRGTSTADYPDYITPDILEASRVTLNPERPAESSDWYTPMTNLPGAGRINMRYTVDGPGWTEIPLELTRAVSKIEVWFRSRGDVKGTTPTNTTTETERIYDGDPMPDPNGYKPSVSGSLSSYYNIDGMTLSMPVSDAGLYSEDSGYDGTSVTTVSGPFNFRTENDNTLFKDYPIGSIPNNFYSDEYFVHIWTYYIFPNTFGGNMAGEDASSGGKGTILTVDYAHRQDSGEYVYDRYEDHHGTEGALWWEKSYIVYEFYWNWVWSDPVLYPSAQQQSKDVYLPACERNTAIRVWCALNDNTDRTFTYTVSDWDETVSVNVPDFE